MAAELNHKGVIFVVHSVKKSHITVCDIKSAIEETAYMIVSFQFVRYLSFYSQRRN